MRYIRFIISNYRAIAGPLEIRVDKHSLMPIVGINESGKTTVLHAIFAFDSYNDDLNESDKHLSDTANLYRTSSPPATVEAEIELSVAELRARIAACEKSKADLKSELSTIRARRKLPTKLLISRNIPTGAYTFPNQNFGRPEVQDALAEEIIARLPYILYFDDFRDKIAEKIEIPQGDEQLTDWPAIISKLFRKTDKNFAIRDLPKLEERQRRTILAKVQRHLNETLTREWQNFRLDDREALEISLTFETSSTGPTRNYIKLEVIETDSSGDKHFFYISDRSKGFYWFFNFVMKLEFNPKSISGGEIHSIYLLDEPGSYLHAFAQRKLCRKLRHISSNNAVIYCTHSHYLLDPEIIPITTIAVAHKNGDGNIGLTRMIDYHGTIKETRSALQPVFDALQVKPYALDLIHTQGTVIVEGIYDYLCLELFRAKRTISVLPSVGAESIRINISLMIAWQIKFSALWDHDTEGKKKLAQAEGLFGSELAARHFRLLPAPSSDSKVIMQNLFGGQDLVDVRSKLGLANNCSFEHTIQALFYSQSRDQIVSEMSQTTKDNFERLFGFLLTDFPAPSP